MCVEEKPVLCDRLLKTTYRNRLPSGGTRLRARGQDVAHFNSTACFADYTVIAEEGAVPVPPDIPFSVLATIGCAVVTGVGAVNNAARVQPGNSVVIIGAGGVGLNVAQGAALAKCDPIIAVDLRTTALTLARDFGATHTVEAPTQNVVEAVRELTHGRGADFVFDTVGAPSTITQAIDCARKGGSILVTGLSRTDTLASIPAFPFVMQEKRLIGSLYGSGQPLVDIPKLAALYQ